MEKQHCQHCLNHEAEIESLKVNNNLLWGRLIGLEDIYDTFLSTPLWKRIWFWINGWPLRKLTEKPKRRFWHRWVKP